MNIVLINAIKNIKNPMSLNIIIVLLSLLSLVFIHSIIITLSSYKETNTKDSREYEVYRINEDKDVFYFNDYEDNDIKEMLDSTYKSLGLETIRKNIVLPASLILRTLSEYVMISAYDEYSVFSNYIVEGNIFTSTNNSAIVTEYLTLSTNNLFQLFIRDSLAGYRARTFFVSGIYSLSNINMNKNMDYIDIVNEDIIYTSFNTITNFLYTQGSGKNPYFERYILYFNDYVKTNKIIDNFNIEGFIIKALRHDNNSISINRNYFLLALLSIIVSSILIISSLNYMQIQHRISKGYLREYKVLSKRSQFIQIFIIDIVAIFIYLLFLKIVYNSFNFAFISIVILLVSSSLSILLSIFRKYEYNDEV